MEISVSKPSHRESEVEHEQIRRPDEEKLPCCILLGASRVRPHARCNCTASDEQDSERSARFSGRSDCALSGSAARTDFGCFHVSIGAHPTPSMAAKE